MNKNVIHLNIRRLLTDIDQLIDLADGPSGTAAKASARVARDALHARLLTLHDIPMPRTRARLEDDQDPYR